MPDQATPLTAKDIKPGMYIRLTEERLRTSKYLRGTTADSWHVDNVGTIDNDVLIYFSSREGGSHIMQYRPDEEVPVGEPLSEQDVPGA